MIEKMELADFIRESNRIEGIDHCWGSAPFAAELEAHGRFVALDLITVPALEAFVATVQPGATLRRTVGMNMRVGNGYPPPGGPLIEEQLDQLLVKARLVEVRHDAIEGGAYSTHLAYEQLHPFTDGNGRSGRVLWLWQMGSAPLGFLHEFYYQTLRAQGEGL